MVFQTPNWSVRRPTGSRSATSGEKYPAVYTGLGLIHRVHETVPDRYAGMLLLAGGCLYLASVHFQFGPLFHGPAGISVPFGIPMLMAVGYVIMTGLFGTVQSWRDLE